MTSAATQTPTETTAPPASERELLDILYEILSDDTGEDFGVSAEQVQSFLHEHARSSRPEGALATFFEEHGLSTRMQDYGRDPALAAVPSGLHLSPPFLSSEATSPRADVATAVALRSTDVPLVQSGYAQRPQPRRPGWLMPTLIALGALVGALGALAVFNSLNERDLERELSLERLQLRATGEAVDGLRAETSRLRDELRDSRSQEQRLEQQVSDLQAAEAARKAQEAAEAEAAQSRRRGAWRH